MGRRGLGKHLKQLVAPKKWMLDKLGGVFAPKPSSGPHKAQQIKRKHHSVFGLGMCLLLWSTAIVCCRPNQVAGMPLIAKASLNAIDEATADHTELKADRFMKRGARMLVARSYENPASIMEFDDQPVDAQKLKPSWYSIWATHDYDSRNNVTMDCSLISLPKYARLKSYNCSSSVKPAGLQCFDPWLRITCVMFDKLGQPMLFPKKLLEVNVAHDPSKSFMRTYVNCETDGHAVPVMGYFNVWDDTKFTFVCERNSSVIRGYGCVGGAKYSSERLVRQCVSTPRERLKISYAVLQAEQATVEQLEPLASNSTFV